MSRLSLVCASLLLCAAWLAAQTDNRPKFKITGTVVNSVSGEPVRAMVDIFGGSTRLSVMAGTDGHFEADGITAGSLYVTARRPGFAPSIQAQRFNVSASSDPITVKLTPLSKISGRVLDREGEPIDGVALQCLRETLVNGRRQLRPSGGVNTDETGNFLMEDLIPGVYLVRTQQKQLYMVAAKSEAARYIYPASYYPDAPSRELAQRIELTPGSEAKVDITLHSVRGSRVRFTTDPPSRDVIATFSPVDSIFEDTPAQGDASQALALTVAPGSWKIVAHGPFSGLRTPYDQAMYGELQIEVGSTDIDNLKISLNKLADIPVLVSNSGKSDNSKPDNSSSDTNTLKARVSNSPVALQLFATVGTMVAGSMPGPDGALIIRNVPPGTYRVVAPYTGGASCITSILSGSQDLLRDELVIPPGASVPPIQVALSDNCAQLSITTNATDHATVLIISNLKAFEPRWVNGSGNTLSALGLPEGDYQVYAFDDVTDLEYANPDAMRGFKSQSVHLEAGQTASVQLELNERHAQ